MDELAVSFSRRTVVAIWYRDHVPDWVDSHESGYSWLMTLSTWAQRTRFS